MLAGWLWAVMQQNVTVPACPLHPLSPPSFFLPPSFLDYLSSLHTLPTSILCQSLPTPHSHPFFYLLSPFTFFLPGSLWFSALFPCQSGWTYLPKDTGNAGICHSHTQTHTLVSAVLVLQAVCKGTIERRKQLSYTLHFKFKRCLHHLEL